MEINHKKLNEVSGGKAETTNLKCPHCKENIEISIFKLLTTSEMRCPYCKKFIYFKSGKAFKTLN